MFRMFCGWSTLAAALLVATGPASVAAQKADGATIPKAARKALDERWKGWQLATIDPQAASCAQDGHAPSALIPGDFDGDGRPDVALAVKTRHGVRLAAVLSRENDTIVYDIDSLGDAAANVSVGVEHRGTKFINPRSMLVDYFPADTLTTSRCGQGRTGYFWTGSGFSKWTLQ
jgi:hypothetical protein